MNPRIPRHRWASLALPALLPVAASCTTGLDSVVFVTKTGLSAELDATPASANLGYTRQEGVLAPVFEDGRVLPVLATIEADNKTWNFYSEQSFATGDAAIILGEVGGADDPYFTGTDASHRVGLDPFRRGAPPDVQADAPKVGIVSSQPHERASLWKRITYWFTGDSTRRRYFFGTDTSTGVHVSYNGSSVPESITIGHSRKELAYVPLIEKKTSDTTCEIKLASLIATHGTTAGIVKAGDTKPSSATRQTFATGDAATLLASQPETRKVLGAVLMPVSEKVASEATALEQQNMHVTVIEASVERIGPERAKALWAKADQLFPESPLKPIDSTAKVDGLRDAQNPDVTSRLETLATFAKNL